MHLTDWPFGLGELLGGLRQYLGAPELQLLDVEAISLPDNAPESDDDYNQRPFAASVRLKEQTHRLGLMLHEGQPELIAREHSFYRFLAPHLPMLTPDLIAGDSLKGWLVLELLSDLRPPDEWNVDDYREAVDNLALLHDRFWDLGEDLDTFPWLLQPLTRDYDILEMAITQATQTLTDDCPLPELDDTEYQATFQHIADNLDSIAAPLQAAPVTLLHGNYWPGNIARPIDGRQIVTHWHTATIGPAILDVVMFHQQTARHLIPIMPLEAAVARYQVQLQERRKGQVWSSDEWETLWAAGLLWQFAVHWMPLLAAGDAEAYTQFVNHWFGPVLEAIEHLLL